MSCIKEYQMHTSLFHIFIDHMSTINPTSPCASPVPSWCGSHLQKSRAQWVSEESASSDVLEIIPALAPRSGVKTNKKKGKSPIIAATWVLRCFERNCNELCWLSWSLWSFYSPIFSMMVSPWPRRFYTWCLLRNNRVRSMAKSLFRPLQVTDSEP